MRFPRPILLAATALAVLVPATSHAQESRPFIDSWYWGAKAGMMTFWTPLVNHAAAPLGGIEWLITKRRAALYLSGEQAFFTENSVFTVYNRDPDDPSSYNADTLGVIPVGEGIVKMHNMRRFSAMLLAFPFERNGLRPYAGVGFSLNAIRGAAITDLVVSPPAGVPCCAVLSSLHATQTSTSAVFMGGVQGQVGRAVVFGQGQIIPANRRFLFTPHSTFVLEGGVRYNVGSARESATH